MIPLERTIVWKIHWKCANCTVDHVSDDISRQIDETIDFPRLFYHFYLAEPIEIIKGWLA